MNSTSQFIGLGIIVVAITVVAWCLQSAETKMSSVASTTIEIGAVSERFNRDLFYLPNDNQLGFVEIPAGEFLMGSDPIVDRMAYDNERWSPRQKQGRVQLPLFYIGRYEVTAAQFKTFVNATGRAVNLSLLPKNPHSPIVNITWVDAMAYCDWLQKQLMKGESTPQTIKELLAQGWTLSLPTEAQWEKAARGDTGNIFPWGNEISNKSANFSDASIKPVGSLVCDDCAYGLADMSGNVWELTRSPYLPYPYTDKPVLDLEADALFVMRGGSFRDQMNNIRAAVRGGVDPGVRNNAIGFRIVLTQE